MENYHACIHRKKKEHEVHYEPRRTQRCVLRDPSWPL